MWVENCDLLRELDLQMNLKKCYSEFNSEHLREEVQLIS
jgi:hypothetical protein